MSEALRSLSEGLAGLYLNAEDGDVMLDGINDAVAVKRNGKEMLEIWDTDFESQLGFLPASMTVEQINAAIRFYGEGLKVGKAMGRVDKENEIKRVLGVS